MQDKFNIPKIKNKTKKRYKNDLPVLDSDQDLSKAFIDETELKSGKKIKNKPEQNKHGIKFIDHDEAPDQKFLQEDTIEEDFSKLLEISLKGKNQSRILREKKDRKLPEPVPIKKRLKKYPPPECGIDLHGYTAQKAEAVSRSFIISQHQKGTFTLRIICGKGLNSEFGPVLPDVVEDLLFELRKKGVVLWFEWEKKKKSKSGAVIVYLKQFTF